MNAINKGSPPLRGGLCNSGLLASDAPSRTDSGALARYFTGAAANGIRAEAHERRIECQAALDDTVRALDKLREAGCGADFLDDTLTGLLDQVAAMQHALDRDLDDAGTWTPEKLDVSEVHALLAKVRGA